jgi:hypothetical protein
LPFWVLAASEKSSLWSPCFHVPVPFCFILLPCALRTPIQISSFAVFLSHRSSDLIVYWSSCSAQGVAAS